MKLQAYGIYYLGLYNDLPRHQIRLWTNHHLKRNKISKVS